MIDLKIRHIMSTELLTFLPQQEMSSAMRALLDENVSGAPVLGATDELLGMLSMRDCLQANHVAYNSNDWGGRVGDYMSKDVQTIDPELDLVSATGVFLQSPYHRFPVLEHNRLVGQVSRCDLLKPLAREWYLKTVNLPHSQTR